MRLRCNRKPLPRHCLRMRIAKGIVLESDLGIDQGRLRAKLLVFDSMKHMREFWRRVLFKTDLGPGCLGAVNSLMMEVVSFKNGTESKPWIETDPRYFCLIGLVRRHLTMEIITHEAAHAGIYYARLKRRAPWDECIRRNNDEAVCYPTGKIAAAIVSVCRANKLIE